MRRRLAVVALLALWPALARAEEALPVYPGTVHTRIGEELVIGGEHYRIAYFVTRDPIQQVADYFFQQWRQKGIPATVDGDPSREVVVSAFYTREGLQRAVVLRTHQRRTVGFVVLKDLWRRDEEPKGAPLRLEGALVSQELVSREEEGGARHQAALLELELPRAKARVEERLEKQGYARLRETRTGDGGSAGAWLEHGRGGERVVTALAEVGPGLVAVLQTQTGSGGAGGGVER